MAIDQSRETYTNFNFEMDIQIQAKRHIPVELFFPIANKLSFSQKLKTALNTS
jgi:hypothetical protein